MLEAQDAYPGGPGDGAGGCGLWVLVSVFELPGVPPNLLVGLDPADAELTRTIAPGIVQSLYRRQCGPTLQYRWFDTTPELLDLLLRARDELVLPVPVPEFSPPAATVRTLVGMETWFWLPSADWAPVERSVTAGAVTVTATATPLVLRFDPGDGNPAVECAGPGEPWANGDTSECAYSYQWVSSHHPSGVWPALVEVDWEVTWTSNVGQAGVLEPIVVATPTPLTVHQAEATLRLPGT